MATSYGTEVAKQAQAFATFLQGKRLKELDLRTVLNDLEQIKTDVARRRPAVVYLANTIQAGSIAKSFCESIGSLKDGFEPATASFKPASDEFELFLADSPNAPRKRLGPGPLSVGRASDADVAIPSDRRYVSKVHLSVRTNGGRAIVTDVSSNGTWVEGRRLEKGKPEAVLQETLLLLGDPEDPKTGAKVTIRPVRKGGAGNSDAARADLLVVSLDPTVGVGWEIEAAIREAATDGRPILAVGLQDCGRPSYLPPDGPEFRFVVVPEPSGDPQEAAAVTASITEWLRAEAIPRATNSLEGRVREQYESLVRTAGETMRECARVLSQSVEAERRASKAAKERQESVGKALDSLVKEAGEHHARLTRDLTLAQEEEFKELFTSSLLARVWRELDRYAPCLERKGSLRLLKREWHSIEGCTAKVRLFASKKSVAWADGQWASLSKRRKGHVRRIRDELAKLEIDSTGLVLDLEASSDEMHEEFQSIVDRRVKLANLEELESNNMASVLFKGAMGTMTMVSMMMFTVGRLVVPQATLSKFRSTTIPEHWQIVVVVVTLLTVLAYFKHLDTKAKKIRQALRKDFDAIIELWFEGITKTIQSRLDRHARLLKMILEERVKPDVALRLAAVAEEMRAADSRISDLQGKLRALDYDPNAVSSFLL